MENSRNRLPPEQFLFRLAGALRTRGLEGQRLCVGLSGGVDSVALLCALHELRAQLQIELCAIHVNHGLSKNADAWQFHCEWLCQQFDVAIQVERVVVNRMDSRGLEAAAREARLTAFSSVSAASLVLAHHRGDQAETVLHRLFRGAGVRGCAGIPFESIITRPDGASLCLLRPLLEFSKETLEDFVLSRGVTWVFDESNHDASYTRNFLRSELLPHICTRYPGVETTLCRHAGLFSEAQVLLQQLARIDLDAVREGDALDMQRLASLGEVRARNLLRFLVDACAQLPPDHDRLKEGVRQLFAAASDREFSIPLGGILLQRFAGFLYLLSTDSRSGAPIELLWSGGDRLDWAGGAIRFWRTVGQGLDLAIIASRGLRIASRRGGERMFVAENRPRKTLKQLFQERQIPPWLRSTAPVFWCGEEVVGVGGIGFDPGYSCAPGKPGVVLDWQSLSPVIPLPRG